MLNLPSYRSKHIDHMECVMFNKTILIGQKLIYGLVILRYFTIVRRKFYTKNKNKKKIEKKIRFSCLVLRKILRYRYNGIERKKKSKQNQNNKTYHFSE